MRVKPTSFVYYVISLDFTLIVCYNHRDSFKNLLIPITLHHRPESWSLATNCQSRREFTSCHSEHWFVVADRPGAWKSKAPQTARHHFLSGAPVVSFSGRVARPVPKSDSQNQKNWTLVSAVDSLEMCHFSLSGIGFKSKTLCYILFVCAQEWQSFQWTSKHFKQLSP